MPRIHLKDPKPKQPPAKKHEPEAAVTIRCPWLDCGHEFTRGASEARRVKLCPNCIRPLRGAGKRSPRRGELTRLASIVSPAFQRQIKGPTPIQARLIDAAATERDEGATPLYLHSVFCQTSLPYRDPGDGVREWRRVNGDTILKILAGEAVHPETREDILLNLPFGPKARTVLMHINQRALLAKSPAVEMEDSLTRFVRRVLELDPNGRSMRTVKEQLARLSASTMRITIIEGGRSIQIKSDIVKAFDLWFPKDERQRVLWPSVIQLSTEYFESLQAHAVPLDEAHIAALSHSAMALDIYSWLAQRLHRIPAGKPARVSWYALHAQFGGEWKRIDNFRRVFRVALKEVTTVYKAARIEEDARGQARKYKEGGRVIVREPALDGLTLYNSPPPVPRRYLPTV